MRLAISLVFMLLMIHPLPILSQQYDVDDLPNLDMEWKGNISTERGGISDIEIVDEICF